VTGRRPVDFPTFIPFVESLGFEFVRWHAGEAEIAVTLREELCNSWNVAHGGVTMTLLDVVMAHAARSPGQAGSADSRGVVTVEMKTTFMQPGSGRLVGKGTLLHRTASMAFCEGSVFDATGVRLAHSTGTFKYLKGLPVGGRLIQRPGASD
jgi:uncharacterized protein (TIGR00369 family)